MIDLSHLVLMVIIQVYEQIIIHQIEYSKVLRYVYLSSKYYLIQKTSSHYTHCLQTIEIFTFLGGCIKWHHTINIYSFLCSQFVE